MRAPDWWESARFQALCVAGSGFRQISVISSRPPAGNAHRWAVDENISKQACAMIVLDYFPKNKDKYLRLIEFCKDVLDICSVLGIFPIVDGSLAVFAYTKNQDLQVNDIDLACSETEFPKIVSALEARGISYKYKEWHVLQILKDDLKVELDSIEYWYKDLSMVFETLQIDHHRVNMLDLNSLKEFYRRGMEDTADKTEENERKKNEAIKVKYEALEKVKG